MSEQKNETYKNFNTHNALVLCPLLNLTFSHLGGNDHSYTFHHIYTDLNEQGIK